MKMLLLSVLCLTCSIVATVAVTENWQPGDRSKLFLVTQGDTNMKANTHFTNFSSSSSSSSSSSYTYGQSGGHSYNYQQTTINLNSSQLKFPYLLKVSAPKAKLVATIKLDGKIIKEINGHSGEINLSPYLSKGDNVVEITGNYLPNHSSIKIEFSGYGTAINQQTSGSGTLKHRMIISVY